MVEVGGEGQIPIMLANTTNTTIKIPRGREVGWAVSASIRENVVGEADSEDGHTHTVVNVEEIVVPTEHKDKISKVIIENRDESGDPRIVHRRARWNIFFFYLKKKIFFLCV